MRKAKKVQTPVVTGDMTTRMIKELRQTAHAMSADAPDWTWEELVDMAADQLGGPFMVDKEAVDAFWKLSHDEQEALMKRVFY